MLALLRTELDLIIVLCCHSSSSQITEKVLIVADNGLLKKE